MSEDKAYFLYLLLCDEKILYTGIAIDPQQRLSQHQQGSPHGAKFTRRFTHLELVYLVEVGNRSVAQSLEIKFKKLTRLKKLQVIKNQPSLSELKLILS